MDYKKHYNLLMTRARSRVNLTETYTESHHVVPKCMGGINDEVVNLLPEGHFLAHLLLVKMHPDVTKLVYAANTLGNCNNKQYGWLKRKFSKTISERMSGKNHPFYGKKRPEHSKKMKTLGVVPPNQKGVVRGEETRALISKNNAMNNPVWRKKAADGRRGRIVSEETKEKLKQAAIKQWEKQKLVSVVSP